jgi:biotin operon repressor
MTLDRQQQRLLALLREAAGQPVTFAELRAKGIAFPAAVASELELHGYAIDRVRDRGRLIGVRLLETAPPVAPAGRRAGRRPRRRR